MNTTLHRNTITLRDYHSLAMRTAKRLDYLAMREHAALGLVSDCGEVATLIKAWRVYGKPLDEIRESLIEELGDVMWFLAYAAEAHGKTFEHLAVTFAPQQYAGVTRSAVHTTLRLCRLAGRYAIRCGAFPEFEKYDEAILTLVNMLDLVDELMEYIGTTFNEVALHNIDKLRARYPHSYSDAAAIARADKGD